MLDGLDGGSFFEFLHLAKGKEAAVRAAKAHAGTEGMCVADLRLIDFAAAPTKLFVKGGQLDCVKIGK